MILQASVIRLSIRIGGKDAVSAGFAFGPIQFLLHHRLIRTKEGNTVQIGMKRSVIHLAGEGFLEDMVGVVDAIEGE